MSTKSFKIKRVFAFAIFRSLRAKPPKDYPTTGEIKTTIGDLLPALKLHVNEYLEVAKKAEEIANKVAAKEVSAKDSESQIEAINKEWRDYNKVHGDEIVEISLDADAFKTLQEQFNREGWGKEWLANLEEYGELLAAFEAVK